MLLAQILGSMKEAVLRCEKALKNEDTEQLMSAKKELLELQKKANQFI